MVFGAGARSATHTFNAMRALNHRDPGIAGYVLDNDDLYAEMICDGIHVDPAMVRLFYKAKGPARAILITDGISATGMPNGQYRLGDLEVNVENGPLHARGSRGRNPGRQRFDARPGGAQFRFLHAQRNSGIGGPGDAKSRAFCWEWKMTGVRSKRGARQPRRAFRRGRTALAFSRRRADSPVKGGDTLGFLKI